MRIKSIRIDRYGPLADFNEGDLANFTLVHGPNERGKTLLLDAILKLLFKKDMKRQSKHFGNIDRVTEEPEGFLVLEEDGREIKLGRKESLSDHVDIGPVDFRNLFVVRDSDSSIVEEKDYYVTISERLAGLRTSEIEKIKQVLQAKGRLTNPSSDSEMSDSAGAEHMARRVRAAQGFIHEIEKRLPLFQNSGFDALERRLVEVKDRLKTKEYELKIFREAEIRGKYQKAQEDLIELNAVLEALGEIGEVNQEDLEKWRELVLDRKRDEDALRAVGEQRKNKEKRLEKVTEAYAEARARVEGFKKSQTGYSDELEPRLAEWRVLKKVLIQKEPHAKFWRWATRLSAVLLVISVGGSFYVQVPILFGVLGLFLLATAASATQVWRTEKIKATYNAAFEDLRDTAGKFGLEISTPDDVDLGSAFKKPVEKELEAMQRKLRDADIGKSVLTGDLFSLAQRTRIHNDNLHKVEDSLNAMKLKSNIDTLEDYRKALKIKREGETRMKSLRAMLSRMLGGKKNQEHMRQFWEVEIERHLSEVPDKGSTQKYDPDLVVIFENEIQTLKKQAIEIDDQLNLGRKELRDLELKITHSNVMEDYKVVCRSIADLQELKNTLAAFVEDAEKRRDIALKVMKVFEEIETEDRSKVVELFGANRAVSKYFKAMTGGRYKEVIFDPVRSSISVRDAGGGVISAYKLSGGALDQLYLSVRLSVAQGIMSDGRGFFLLDDAFVKADIDRLRSQLTLLQTLSDSGWQIIYFSAKQEVLDALQPNIKTEQVRLIQLRDVLPEPKETEADSVSDIVELFPME